VPRTSVKDPDADETLRQMMLDDIAAHREGPDGGKS
jgi:hypothetical protein